MVQKQPRGRLLKELKLHSVTGVGCPEHTSAVRTGLALTWRPGKGQETYLRPDKKEVGWRGRGRAGCQGERLYRSLPMTGCGMREKEGEMVPGFWLGW